MRIINAMLSRGQGGIEQALVDYCEALRFAGHEAHALVHPQAHVRPVLEKLGILCHMLPNWGAWDFFAELKLARLLKYIRPHACIAHGNRSLSLLANAMRGHSRVKSPLVAVMHNYSIRYEKAPILFYSTQDILRHVEAGDMRGKCAYPVPNLVRAPANEPVRHWHSPPVIGGMGRFVAKKGFDIFIEAIALMKAQGASFRALLAGDGEEAEALKNLARTRGLEGMLHFMGWVEDKQAFFDSMDMFCLPSHHEPFGIVLLEAMAQALPVVATDSEGPSEIIHGGIDGMLVPKDDPAALAGALAGLLVDRQRAELLARNAYDKVKNRYDLPVVARKLDLALRSVCKL